jgi:hypothetical protein
MPKTRVVLTNLTASVLKRFFFLLFFCNAKDSHLPRLIASVTASVLRCMVLRVCVEEVSRVCVEQVLCVCVEQVLRVCVWRRYCVCVGGGLFKAKREEKMLGWFQPISWCVISWCVFAFSVVCSMCVFPFSVVCSERRLT